MPNRIDCWPELTRRRTSNAEWSGIVERRRSEKAQGGCHLFGFGPRNQEQLSSRRAPGARGKAKEGEHRTRTRRPPRPGGGFSPPRAAGGYDRDGARGRNRQAAGASIPWLLLVSGACGRVPRESSGPATGAPHAGSARRAKVPGTANGVRAGRALAYRDVWRQLGPGIEERSRDGAVRSLRSWEKAGRAKTSPSLFRTKPRKGRREEIGGGYRRGNRSHESASAGSGARKEVPATGWAAVQATRFPPWCTGIRSAILQFSPSAMTARTSTLMVRLPCSMLER